jgi:hypothetical protein
MMTKIISFIKNISPMQLLFAGILLEVIAIFLQKYLPTVALTFQLFSFGIFIYAAIKFFNKKF